MTTSDSSPSETAEKPEHKCACYRFTGARECFSLRYRRDYIFGENYGSDEVCECSCHNDDEDYDDD